MSSKILLRIAALLLLLHGIGYTFGVATWKDTNGDIAKQIPEVVRLMQSENVNFKGIDSTMARFYDGFGYCGTIFLFFLAILLWILACRKDKSVIKILWVTCGAIVALAMLEMIYFFPMAWMFCLISTALIVVSIFQIQKNDKRSNATI